MDQIYVPICRPLALFGQELHVQAIGVGDDWLARFDALVGAAFQGHGATEPHMTFTVERNPHGQWAVADGKIATLTHDANVALREVEWQLFAAAVRQAANPLIMHAGAVARSGQAIILPAPSGSGKTTLTLALQARGWAPLTDDLCALELRDGALWALPCARCCHVSRESQALLADLGVTLTGLIADLEDYFRPTQLGEAASVTRIIAPHYAPDAVCSLTPLTQAEAAALLITSSFEQAGKPMRARWDAAIQLAMQAPAWRLTYSQLADAFAAIEQVVG